MAFEKLAEIIFPNVEHDREYYIAKYPKRNLKEGARVTRYAPSPTGFQHIGGVFAALIEKFKVPLKIQLQLCTTLEWTSAKE